MCPQMHTLSPLELVHAGEMKPAFEAPVEHTVPGACSVFFTVLSDDANILSSLAIRCCQIATSPNSPPTRGFQRIFLAPGFWGLGEVGFTDRPQLNGVHPPVQMAAPHLNECFCPHFPVHLQAPHLGDGSTQASVLPCAKRVRLRAAPPCHISTSYAHLGARPAAHLLYSLGIQLYTPCTASYVDFSLSLLEWELHEGTDHCSRGMVHTKKSPTWKGRSRPGLQGMGHA